jgi:hypothetical protein
MRVRNAKLHDVVGRPAKQAGFTIIPAQLDLDGTMFQPSFHLRELPSGLIPPVLRVPLEQQFDVAWVRARLSVVFGFTPEPSEMEKTFLQQAFVAVPEGSDEGIAFECSDYYGKTSLTFSQAEADEALKTRVADAFWRLLLSEPVIPAHAHPPPPTRRRHAHQATPPAFPRRRPIRLRPSPDRQSSFERRLTAG